MCQKCISGMYKAKRYLEIDKGCVFFFPLCLHPIPLQETVSFTLILVYSFLNFSGFLFDWNSGWSQDKCNNWRSGNTTEGPAPPQYVSRQLTSLPANSLLAIVCTCVHVFEICKPKSQLRSTLRRETPWFLTWPSIHWVWKNSREKQGSPSSMSPFRFLVYLLQLHESLWSKQNASQLWENLPSAKALIKV